VNQTARDLRRSTQANGNKEKHRAVRAVAEIMITLAVMGLIVFNVRNILSFSPDPPVIYEVPKIQEPPPPGARKYKSVQFTTRLYDEKFTRTLGLVSHESFIYITRNAGEDFFGYIYNGSQKVEGYLKAGDVVPWDTPLYAEIPAGKSTGNLVDVRRVVPNAEIYMVLATEDTIFKRQYPRDLCLLQSSTARKLAEAQQKAEAVGFRLKIYDAYRPRSVQYELWKYMPDSSYVGDPETGSNHNRGAAADLTLVDINSGRELDMPTGIMDYAGGVCRRGNSNLWTLRQKENVEILTGIMESCGFTPLSSEWWHYDDTDKGMFPLSDLDFTMVKMSVSNS
jgi:D-alanyl-D-alanine dipeptidase